MAWCADDVAAALKSLEEELLNPRVRKDERRLGQLLAEEFREFGSSGRMFTREQIVAALEGETAVEIGLEGFVAQRLADGCVLVTYRSRRYEGGSMSGESLRSSIWVEREGRWQMVFHQGTKV